MAVQTATIVVTDLVGSTELRVRVGEGRAEHIRRLHDRALSGAAGAAGGVVVKSLGDGLLVMFAGAANALGAAIAMQQALELLARDEGEPLSMRVGVSAGDVTLERGDTFGTPVIEASRLCAEAQAGEILVAAHIRYLVRGREGLELVSCGERVLRGLPEAVEVCALGWEPVHSRVDLGAEMPFVGRESERRVFEERARAASSGRGGLVLLSGEAGIGKTRFVREMCERVDTMVLWGGCHDGEALSYTPFVEAITEWLRATTPADARAVLGIDGPILARMAPAMRELVAGAREEIPVPPEEAAAQLHEAACQFLARVAPSQLLILVLDDLHWADDATVRMLRAVARRAQSIRLLVVGIYRMTDIDRRHPLAQALPVLRHEGEPTHIELVGLSPDEVQGLLERLSRHEVPAAFVEVLVRRTEGNPFFVRETLLHLAESGRIQLVDGTWVAKTDYLAIPEGVRDVVGRRLSRLSDPANRLLGVASLSESSFSLPIAAEVAQLDDDEALDALDEALRARIVAATDTFDEYEFTHALFRQALVEEINPSRQARLHRSMAEATEKSVRGVPTIGQAAALLRHYRLSATLAGSERGQTYALAIADDARRRYAYRQEYDALTVARELDPDAFTEERFSRLLAAAVLSNLETETLVREFERAGEAIATELGPDRAAEVLAETIGITPSAKARTRLSHVARRWLEPNRRDLTWVIVRVHELYDDLLKHPEYPGALLETPEWCEVREVWIEHWFEARALPMAVPFTNLSRSEAEHLLAQLPPEHAWTGFDGTLGRYRKFLAGLRAQIDHERAHRLQARLIGSLAFASQIESALGMHDDAMTSLSEATAMASEVDHPAVTYQVLGATVLRGVVCGEDPSIVDVATLEQLTAHPNTRWVGTLAQVGTAETLARAGRGDEAIERLGRCLDGIERAARFDPQYPLIIQAAAGTLFFAERTEHLDIIERNLRTKVLEPDFRFWVTDSRWSLARLCAASHRTEEARHWFAEARNVLTEQECVALLVNVDYDHAITEARARNPDEALALIATARDGCTHPSMAPWLARLDALETTLENPHL